MKSTDVENLQNTVIQWKTVYTIQTKNMLNQIKQKKIIKKNKLIKKKRLNNETKLIKKTD